jgi:alcohol dehydrogenase (cytochrome c)
LYWGVGNPNPWPLGDLRPGDNLYSSSLVALDPDTGALRWHFQFSPHDVHDWDAAQVPVLAEIPIDGRSRQVLMTANRNGFFYVLDRASGKFLRGSPFARQDWADRLDAGGRPIVSRNIEPTYEGNRISPSIDGATSWWAPAFNPATGLFYVTAQDATETYRIPNLVPASQPDATVAEARALSPRDVDAGTLRTQVRALDPATGAVQWEFPLPLRSTPGLLTTAGGLVFFGSTMGDFWAADAETGRMLFSTKVDGFIHAAPISFEAGGKQMIAVASRSAVWAFEAR